MADKDNDKASNRTTSFGSLIAYHSSEDMLFLEIVYVISRNKIFNKIYVDTVCQCLWHDVYLIC